MAVTVTSKNSFVLTVSVKVSSGGDTIGSETLSSEESFVIARLDDMNSFTYAMSDFVRKAVPKVISDAQVKENSVSFNKFLNG